jgi:predicted dehydrogenase
VGPTRVVRAGLALPAPKPGADLLRAPALPGLLAGCVSLLGAPPAQVWAMAAEGSGLATLSLEAGEGRAVQVSVWAGAAGTASCRVEVSGERGTAAADLPGRLSWRDAEGRHTLRLPHRPAEEVVLLRFAEAVRGGLPAAPGIEEAHAALGWLRAAWQSRSEGRRIPLGEVRG